MQGLRLSDSRQRLFSAWNHSPMGYALPAAIGASVAASDRSVICITGDGGLQMNVQDLATVERMRLPIKMFVMNNHGHRIVQGTQDQWLQARHVTSNFEGELPDPDYIKVASAYGLPTVTMSTHLEVETSLASFLHSDGPNVCVVEMLPGAQIAPKLTAGAGFHDLSPKISPQLIAQSLKYAATEI